MLSSGHRLQLQYPSRSSLLPNRWVRLVKLNITLLLILFNCETELLIVNSNSSSITIFFFENHLSLYSQSQILEMFLHSPAWINFGHPLFQTRFGSWRNWQFHLAWDGTSEATEINHSAYLEDKLSRKSYWSEII